MGNKIYVPSYFLFLVNSFEKFKGVSAENVQTDYQGDLWK